MICLMCRQSETVDGFTSVALERGEMRLSVNNGPAHVCPSCGEAYVEENVAVQVLNQAEDKYQAGILHSVLDFSAFVSTE